MSPPLTTAPPSPLPGPSYDSDPPSSAPPPAGADIGRRLYEDELKARMSDLGIDDTMDDSIRTQELRYWRKKVSLEEEAAVKQAGMLLTMLSSFLESFTSAVGFKTIRTQGLSDAIQTALEAGDFDLAIKSYCISPQAISMLKNPITSFMTSFGHVVLRTHIENMKKELAQGVKRYNRTPPTHVHDDGTTTETNSATTRPSFAVNTPSAPTLASVFRQKVTQIAPVLTVMKSVMTNNNTSSDTGTYDPSTLQLG